MELLRIMAVFTAGVGCGVLATRSYFKTRYETFANEEIESVKDIYSKKLEEADNKMEESNKKEAQKEYNEAVEPYISSVPPSDLSHRDEYEKKMSEAESPQDDILDYPYQITSMEYMDDGGVDKKVATYFVDDEVLIVDGEVSDDGEIADIDQTVGQDNIEILLTGFDDGSALYVRNPMNGVDYEVTKSYASYSEMMG